VTGNKRSASKDIIKKTVKDIEESKKPEDKQPMKIVPEKKKEPIEYDGVKVLAMTEPGAEE